MKDYYLIKCTNGYKFGVMATNANEASETAEKIIQRHYEGKYSILAVKYLPMYDVVKLVNGKE